MLLNKYEYQDKVSEKALDKCLDDLNVTSEEIVYKEYVEEGSFLKASKTKIVAFKKNDILEIVKEYLKELTNYMDINTEISIKYDEDIIKVNLNSEKSSNLIGKNGKMLNSIQILVRKTLENQLMMPIKINIDIENYKEKKMHRLEKNIKRICYEVMTSKIDVKLDPMNSYERRLVHNIVSSYSNLTSSSAGEAPNRYVVIKYDTK